MFPVGSPVRLPVCVFIDSNMIILHCYVVSVHNRGVSVLIRSLSVLLPDESSRPLKLLVHVLRASPHLLSFIFLDPHELAADSKDYESIENTCSCEKRRCAWGPVNASVLRFSEKHITTQKFSYGNCSNFLPFLNSYSMEDMAAIEMFHLPNI